MSLHRHMMVALTATAMALTASVVNAETLNGALAKAYENNSSLNSARAGVRILNENVPIAKSGMRPKVSATAGATVNDRNGTASRIYDVGISLDQPIFDGFQTANNVQKAEAGVRASQSGLLNTEVLLLNNAVNIYLDVLNSRQIANLRARNIEFLNEQLRSSRSRFEVGEGTRTDVALAEAASLSAQAELAAARALVSRVEAEYRQIIGDNPNSLQMPKPIASLLPKTLESAISIALAAHPAISSKQHSVDAASFGVKATEGSMLPGVRASASLSKNFNDTNNVGYSDDYNATIGLKLTVPIYQGGLNSAQVRKSKEELGQARIDVDVVRDQVRAAVSAAWAGYKAAQDAVKANREGVSASNLALQGMVEERNVGQRTTLDVLQAQGDVIRAQIGLINSQTEVVSASYAILTAMGHLTAERLGLQVALQNPKEHYNAVKDKSYGTRTPDGR